ncbi:hypothetical protein IMZ48_07755 [Candidatus Bathyarchaeota archaeon]|nr:hypothetical protein [Candidatus Bathyarchaeota archaeon]
MRRAGPYGKHHGSGWQSNGNASGMQLDGSVNCSSRKRTYRDVAGTRRSSRAVGKS